MAKRTWTDEEIALLAQHKVPQGRSLNAARIKAWEDFDMVEIHKSGVITKVSSTDGPKVLYGRSMSNCSQNVITNKEQTPCQNQKKDDRLQAN